MQLLWFLIVGLVIGLLARFFKPGDDSMGLMLTTLLGVGGAFVAGLVGQTIGLYAPGEPAGFFASIIGAIALLFIGSSLKRKA